MNSDIPFISAAQYPRTLAWYNSLTCASWEDDKGRGFLEGMGRRGISGSGSPAAAAALEGAIVAIN